MHLAEGELHVWIAGLDVADHDLDGLLSPQERERARGFLRARDARRWEASRGLLRLLLGEYLGADPRALVFRAGEHGKPRLAGSNGALRFNLSHSGAIAVYAVALGVEVGVDVEGPRRRRFDALAVAERAFGTAVAVRLARLGEAEREREFRRLWVRHEAALKCVGVGLGGGAKASADNRACWTMDIDAGRLAAAAIAAPREPARVKRWCLDAAGCGPERGRARLR